MKEIIPLCFGQCGINIGSDFIQQIYKEQGLEFSSSNLVDRNHDNINLLMMKNRGEPSIYFSESSENTFTSRSLLIDLQNEFKYDQSKLYNSGGIQQNNRLDLNKNVIFPKKDDTYCSPYWPGGKYEDGGVDEFASDVLDRVRKLVEDCDSFHGFQFFHGMVGSSSGFFSRIVTQLREEYFDKVFWLCSLFHDSESEDKAVWMYDSILTLQYMIENSEMITSINNKELIEKCAQNGIKKPNYRDLNNVIRNYFPNITSVFRYPSEQGCDLRKMCVSLSPFYRCLTEVCEISELRNENNSIYETIYDMNRQLIQTKSTNDISIISAISILRANEISTLEAGNQIRKSVKDHAQSEFPFKSLIVNQLPGENTISNTLITNSTSINSTLKHLNEVMEVHFRRKAYIYGYTRNGLDEMELTEAQYNLKDVIELYDNANNEYEEEEVEE